MVSNPEVMKQQAKAHEAKRKRDEKKAASRSTNPSSKKRKTTAIMDTIDNDDDDDDKEPTAPMITAYALIPKKAPVNNTKGKPRSKANNTDDILQKGPFTFNSTNTYETFLIKLATTLPCRVENINQNKIQWKPKKPATTPLLILGAAAGYRAMVDEMSSRKPGDRSILLSMPPPIEPMDDKIVPSCILILYANTDIFGSHGQLMTSQDLTMTNLSL
jgi:hypothetical protein